MAPLHPASSVPAASSDFEPKKVYPAVGFVTFFAAHPALVTVIFITVLLQAYLLGVSAPNQFPDSGVYFDTGRAFLGGDWGFNHFAYRTPGYPLFLAFGESLFGRDAFGAIMGLQIVTGIALPPLLYGLFRMITPLRWLAAAGALSFYLDRFSVGMQTVLLTEWFSALSVVAVLVVFRYGLTQLSWKTALLAGVVMGFNILIRPSFNFLPLCLALGAAGVLFLSYGSTFRPRWKPFTAWLVSTVLIAWLVTLPWRLFLWSKFGTLTLSFILGVSLSNHMGPVMEKAPDRYGDVRDLYVKIRNSRENQNHMDVGWQVLWDHQAATGESHAVAAKKLQGASQALILREPGLYARQLWDGWNRIWNETPYYITDLTDPYGNPRGVEPTAYFINFVVSGPLNPFYQFLDKQLWTVPGRLVLVPWTILALGMALTFISRREPFSVITIWMIIGTVFYHCLVHIAANYTEFGRYRLPAQPLWFPLMIFGAGALLAHAVQTWRESLAADESHPGQPRQSQAAVSPRESKSSEISSAASLSKGSGRRSRKSRK
jgi:hypothetical protein